MSRSRASQVYLPQRLSSLLRTRNRWRPALAAACGVFGAPAVPPVPARLGSKARVPPRHLTLCALAVLWAAGGGFAHAAEVRPIDWLTRARVLYNERQFDQAIANAERVVRVPELASRARLVIGRSQLEKFRQSANTADLVAARAALGDVDAATLPARERSELVIGFGEALYLDNLFGAAAEVFATALGPDVSTDVRDSAIDWWATSVDRLAQLQAPDDREAIYAQIVSRMERELERDVTSASAAYWLAAAARGAGDLDRAWDAAIAGWVRAMLSPQRGRALRADLDHLVDVAIIPERAREMAETPVEREKAVALLRSEWETVKGNWK
jgi:hypothetical protein